MISGPDRQKAVQLIEEAHKSGARLHAACDELRISVRTWQRWTRNGRQQVHEDMRPKAARPAPSNKLSEAEKRRILGIADSRKYQSLPPGQIVPDLADEGLYLASESTFYRILREVDQQHHRGQSAGGKKRKPPTSHMATEPNQLWSWDITWLPAEIRGKYYYLYLIVDIYSRYITGWKVWDEESAEHVETLVRKAFVKEQIWEGETPLVLHSDNGSPMKAATFKATLERLGISNSYSRPRVSNDNAYSESLFRTFKYRPAFPKEGFSSLQEAREWVHGLVVFPSDPAFFLWLLPEPDALP